MKIEQTNKLKPTISAFWLAYCAGLINLSPAWAARDDAQPIPEEEMYAWLRLSDHEQLVYIAEVSRLY